MNARLSHRTRIAKDVAVVLEPELRNVTVTKRKNIGHVFPAHATLGLSVALATTAEQLAALKDDYGQVLQASANKLPFSLHEWHMAWCEHFLESRSHLKTTRHFYAVRDADGRCVAILPFILTKRSVGPIRISSLDLVGSDPGLTEIRGPIIRPGFEARVAWVMQRELATLRSVDWVRWNNINGPFGDALAIASRLQTERPVKVYILDLPPTWELLRAGLKRNIRESIRHCYNSLKRDGISFEFKVADTADSIHAGLDRYFALHEMRAKLQGTVAHRNTFRNERMRNFFRDICRRLAPLGAVRLFQLIINGEVVAARAAFVVDDCLYLYFSGFDPKWGDYGVMTTTLVEAIKYALLHQMKTVNFSTGHDISKSRWGVREVSLDRAVSVNPSRLSQLAWAGFNLASEDGPKPSLLGRLSRPAAHDWG
jgi:CelD/BcsL family acetyltransferase involved in cellulose biosynthesis